MQEMTGRARKEMQSMKQASGGAAPRIMSNDPTQPEAGSSNCKMHGNESPCKVNDPLATVDTDNRPCGALPPHESSGQSSEHVAASAPQLRRQVDDVNPQECKESRTRDSSDVPEMCGGLQTHAMSDEMQVTPLVVPESLKAWVRRETAPPPPPEVHTLFTRSLWLRGLCIFERMFHVVYLWYIYPLSGTFL